MVAPFNRQQPRGAADSGEAEDWSRAPEDGKITPRLRRRSGGDDPRDGDHGGGPMDTELGNFDRHFNGQDLDVITSKINSLSKWRNIFSQQGLQFKDTIVKQDLPRGRRSPEEEASESSTERSGSSSERRLPNRQGWITFKQECLQTLELSATHKRGGETQQITQEAKGNQRFGPEPFGKKYQHSRKVEDGGESGAGASQSAGAKAAGHLVTCPKTFLGSSIPSGLPITLKEAVALRKILFGTAFQVFNHEWKKSYFRFRTHHSDLSYALVAERGGARSVQMAVQAHILKHLLFRRNTAVEEDRNDKRLLEVSQKDQEKALAAALSDILWRAGEGVQSVVCLITAECYFAPAVNYKIDSYTERLQLFNFTDKAKLERFVAEQIHCFKDEGCHGVILFLYSLLFSKTLEKLHKDMDHTNSHLLQISLWNFTCRQALINLMLTGRASPNVFNGDLHFDDQGALLKDPQYGILARSEVGYLYWNKHELDHDKLPQVGSMLKTPKMPIWLCNINNAFSVLFCTKQQLLSDWKMEHLFDLYFYTGQPSQTKSVTLTIDTHSHHWEEGMHEKEDDPEKKFPPVLMTIRTKWKGAAIDWNGMIPFY